MIDDSNQPRKRIRHFEGRGDARELTFSCDQRKPLLTKPDVIRWFLDALQRTKDRHPIHLWAYVVMPEHVHVLVWPHDPACSISNVLRTLKSSVSKRAQANLRQQHPQHVSDEFHFWQAGPGYDRNLYESKIVWDVIDYIHLNPVRRGLCQRPEDWPWSSAREFGGAEVEFSLIDRTSLPDDPREEHGYAKP